MEIDFFHQMTDDGSFSLYNKKIGDIYHSSCGAYTEALQKFVYPSEIVEFAKKNNCVRILDICFGLGYNSKAAVNEILNVNPNCKIFIDAIEIDPNVLALSCLIKIPNIDENIQKRFNHFLIKHKEVKKSAEFIFTQPNFYEIFDLNLSHFYKIKSKKTLNYINDMKNNLNKK